MKSKLFRILTILAFCFPVIAALAPPLASPAMAEPSDVLTATFVMPMPAVGDYRPFNLSSGDAIVQFTRDDIDIPYDVTG